MAWTEQDYQEIVARLKTESQGVGDVPNAETLTGISSLPAYQEKDGEDIIVRAPLELLAAPALEAADKANAAATKANQAAGTIADRVFSTDVRIIKAMTEEEYIALGEKDKNTLYIIID